MGELDFKEAFKPLREAINDFTNIHGLVRKDLTEWNNVVGINASAFIRVKKKMTMKRVVDKITSLDAPFKVVDYDDSSGYFKIMIK